jgi:NAD-dependent SIR2 family protein deacetylase
MTRCVSCNKNLNDYESTRKDLHNVYLDMCNKCYHPIQYDVPTIDRPDLNSSDEIEPELQEEIKE